MVRIDEERGCVRVVFESTMTLPELCERSERECGRVNGLLEAAELTREGDCYALCVRNRESLKAYSCHHVLALSDYLKVLFRMRDVLESLIRENLSVYNCVWDVDCIFIGEKPENAEILYIPGLSGQNEKNRETPFSDMLTVFSLRIAESRENALQTLSDVLRDFTEWEKNVLCENHYSAEPFERAERLLLPFCRQEHGFFEKLTKMQRVFPKRKKKKALAGKLILSGNAFLERRKWVLRPGGGTENAFQLGRLASGKDAIRLPFPVVSRSQAVIFRDESGWSIEDRASRNGTFLNGVRLKENTRYPLRPDSLIWFGNDRIAFRVQY